MFRPLTADSSDKLFAELLFSEFLARIGSPEVLIPPHFTRRSPSQARGYWRAQIRAANGVKANLVILHRSWKVGDGGESFTTSGKSIESLEFIAYRAGRLPYSAIADRLSQLGLVDKQSLQGS